MGIFDIFKSGPAFDPFQEAEPWFLKQNLDLDSILFSAYDNARLVANSGAVALVGNADTKSGTHIGFVIEVVQGRGVVADALLHFGIATWHRKAADRAHQTGTTLMAVLKQFDAEAEKRK